MTNFFDRKRADMGVHVFNHMRHHTRADTIPTANTYIAAFLGCAKLKDIESLEVVHNQLKLDFNITTTTHLLNALLLAYTQCGEARKALGFWDEISSSAEGPTYNSIHAALRACEVASFGDMKALELWQRLKKSNVQLDQSMWASYAAALAGNGHTNAAITEVERAEGKGELELDAFLVGSIFNAAEVWVKQEEIEMWCRSRDAKIWAQLEKIGIESGPAQTRICKIDRSVSP